METKHTPGPWYFDGHGAIWRRPPSDLYENGGEVAGDRPIATVHIGWHRDGANGYPVEANARLMAAAPELLEACQTFAEWLRREDAGFPAETRFNTPDGEAKWHEWYGENLRVCALAQEQARAAIAKATGAEA